MLSCNSDMYSYTQIHSISPRASRARLCHASRWPCSGPAQPFRLSHSSNVLAASPRASAEGGLDPYATVSLGVSAAHCIICIASSLKAGPAKGADKLPKFLGRYWVMGGFLASDVSQHVSHLLRRRGRAHGVVGLAPPYDQGPTRIPLSNNAVSMMLACRFILTQLTCCIKSHVICRIGSLGVLVQWKGITKSDCAVVCNALSAGMVDNACRNLQIEPTQAPRVLCPLQVGIKESWHQACYSLLQLLPRNHLDRMLIVHVMELRVATRSHLHHIG